jgi:hypothetical protein
MNRGDFASLFGWVAAIFPLSQEGSQVDLGLLILLFESRWTGCDAERIHQYAPELVALAPDVILAPTNSHVWPLRQITRTIPIVFG